MNDIAIQRFSGFADLYDKARPKPPAKTCQILTGLLKRDKVGRVVDLGCGSGLSSIVWQSYAEHISGIEPTEDMRLFARNKYPEIDFFEGSSYSTGLPDACADIVICSQSFHWMEPTATLKEVNRILSDRGVFAALDCDWPVCISVEAERFIEIALSQGQLQTLRKHGISELGQVIESFQTRVRNDITHEKDMFVSYRLVIGVK